MVYISVVINNHNDKQTDNILYAGNDFYKALKNLCDYQYSSCGINWWNIKVYENGELIREWSKGINRWKEILNELEK
jgi:hypothetical protein